MRKTLMTFQTCLTFSLLCNIKEDILRNVSAFFVVNNNKHSEYCLFHTTKKESHSGIEQQFHIFWG